MRLRLGAYARISLDDENDQLGVGRQCKDIDAIASIRDFDIHDYYVDNNVSAFQPNVERDDFERLLRDLEARVINGIAVYDLDRLVRRPSDLERVIAIYEKVPGLVFVTVQGSIDLSTPDGLTMARVLVAFANKASMDTSRRVKRKNVERAENGLPHGSRRPYGYQADQLTLDPKEAPVLRQMGKMLLSGESYKGIAHWLNEQGYRTTTGKLWYPITIRNTLRRPRYAAIRVHNGLEYDGIWEPVFTRSEWDAIQYTIRRRRAEAGEKPAARKYLLTGLVVCGKCGHYLNGETKRDPSPPGKPAKKLRRVYYCRTVGDAHRKAGCGGVTRNADALEHFIRELICTRLDTPELADLIEGSAAEAEVAELLGQREEVVALKNGLIDDYADGAFKTRADFMRAQSRVEARLATIDEKLDTLRIQRLNVALSAGESVRDAYMRHSDGWRRELIDMFVTKITINVGKTKPYYDVDGVRMRFDPNLIDIAWKN